MQTIQVVMDQKLVRAADLAARRNRCNRSALIREALRRHLKDLRIQELERQERRAYLLHPDTEDDLAVWEKVIAWPED